jgi:hypothetical protein
MLLTPAAGELLVRQEAFMTPLFGHAGWGGIVEALACMFLCAGVGIVGFALAGAVFRSPVLVGISFILAVAVVANIELSCCGYMVWAIALLAPLVAVGSFFPDHRPDPDSPDDTEPAPESPRVPPALPDWRWLRLRSGWLVVLAAVLALMATLAK